MYSTEPQMASICMSLLPLRRHPRVPYKPMARPAVVMVLGA